MATSPVAAGGVLVCPYSLLPQTSTVPSARRARLCARPAATLTTFVARGGTSACPSQSRPQPTTEPSFLSARLCPPPADRKSTRLNSSHLGISYAVFCLKK